MLEIEGAEGLTGSLIFDFFFLTFWRLGRLFYKRLNAPIFGVKWSLSGPLCSCTGGGRSSDCM